ncbi:MAG: DNA adenine methylase, partial [Candidatus Andersenbacteria bacterium]|nr:DNA adenine methylase [Candidatus Andersenbacteria bacterium]
MYNWHKFWSRKTWNVVAEYIKAYCPEGGIVFDPFAGSGVVAMEALKHKRRAIVCDILPVATEIARLTIKPVSLIKLRQAHERIERKVKDKILGLYKTKCRQCGHVFPMTCAIWTQSREDEISPIARRCIDIRYAACPRCGDRREKDTRPDRFDHDVMGDIEAREITSWYPRQKLYHRNGKPFMKKEKYESVDELFTKRNLQALSWLMEAIEEEPNQDLRDFLKVGFSSMVHLCTTMCPISEGGHFTPFSSAWTQHSYWFASGPFMEQNVWNKFESAIVGHQGLMKAKKESNEYFRDVRFARSWQDVIEDKADVYIYNGSSFDLMESIRKKYGDDGCVDYIFTDPPYDASVQYGELAYLWVTWLKKDEGYLERIARDEVVRNLQQDKDFGVYHSLLGRSFADVYHVLKPDAYLTVTFHNPTFKVRNATIYAAVYAGFEYQKIHHQELARPSAKSLLQPFGSAQGDFYLRFYKSPADEQAVQPREIDEVRFEKVVVETTIKVLAERG